MKDIKAWLSTTVGKIVLVAAGLGALGAIFASISHVTDVWESPVEIDSLHVFIPKRISQRDAQIGHLQAQIDLLHEAVSEGQFDDKLTGCVSSELIKAVMALDRGLPVPNTDIHGTCYDSLPLLTEKEFLGSSP